MSDIKAIDKSTVHRICSGQVVLSLAIAVKELVENSLDAGATVIDVKFKDFGSEQIEVADNGSGIHPSNFQGLTLKHHTSKLRDFSDLMSVETFGFRGEALSSLCALSELSVVTRHESQKCGTGLMFDRNGYIVEEKMQARQVGTSVFVKNLFSTLPVRQKEFHKNLKREFHKMTQLMYAYCLVSTGVKITCVNQTQKGARTTIMSTQGSKTVKENVSSLFGSKQLNTLLEFKQKVPPEEELNELKATSEDCKMLNIEGYVSSCSHGAGKAASNRQFYFINSRPCEPSKIIKQVNQIYHQFNKHQFPFVFLNICLDRGSADVNVTPDKRQIFLTDEKLILAIIKASLLDLFDKIPSTLVLNVLTPTSNAKNIEFGEPKKPNFKQFEAWKHKNDLKRPSDSCKNDFNPPKQLKTEKPIQKTLESFEIKHKKTDTLPSNSEISSEITGCSENSDDNELQGNCIVPTVETSNIIESCESVENNIFENSIIENGSVLNESLNNELECHQSTSNQIQVQEPSPVKDLFNDVQMQVQEPSPVKDLFNDVQMQVQEPSPVKDLFNDVQMQVQEPSPVKDSLNHYSEDDNKLHFVNEVLSIDGEPKESTIVYDEYVERKIRTISCSVNLDSIKYAMTKRIAENNNAKHKKKKTSVKFRAAIDPSKNEEAEKELTKEISKDMFEKMEIIGQFNHGFIIAKLDSDLLIIDQHASDEKYNFETLQKTTVLNTQRLVVPQCLELAAEHESILMDNLEIFTKNGFKFEIDEEAPPTKKVSLTAIPMSKNTVFGKEDIDEMIFMLQDSQGSNCRPSRVRAMFASRACRKSVMIGTALNERQMRQLINNMATIEQPWNCPHGRPTLRHLLNLDLIQVTPI